MSTATNGSASGRPSRSRRFASATADVRRVADLLEARAAIAFGQLGRDDIEVEHDHRQRVVEVVRDTARERRHRFEALHAFDALGELVVLREHEHAATDLDSLPTVTLVGLVIRTPLSSVPFELPGRSSSWNAPLPVQINRA